VLDRLLGFELLRNPSDQRHRHNFLPAFNLERVRNLFRLVIKKSNHGKGFFAALFHFIDGDAVRAKVTQEIRVLLAGQVRLFFVSHPQPFSYYFGPAFFVVSSLGN